MFRNGLNLENYDVLNDLKNLVIDRSGNITTTMLKLIQMGDALKEKQNIMDLNFEILRNLKLLSKGNTANAYEKVQGCMATVFIRTSLNSRELEAAVRCFFLLFLGSFMIDYYNCISIASVTSNEKIFDVEEDADGISSNIISIDGFADSRVAQGMLALIIEVLILFSSLQIQLI